MSYWISAAEKIEGNLRLKTPVVGIKFLHRPDFPEGCFRPSERGLKMAMCQAISFARRHERVVGVTIEDMNCPPAQILYGWAQYDFSEVVVEAGFARDAEVAKKQMEAIPKLEFGRYRAVLISPLRIMTEEPDVAVIFGNPAQIGRLIHARAYYGGEVDARLQGKFASCGEAVIDPFIAKDCTIAVPGAGDRIYGAIEDDEMIFGLHVSWLERISEGLELAGRGAGITYPPRVNLFFEPRFPRFYREAQKMFRFPDESP